MRPDFRDIRFAQSDGTVCRYYIESYTSRTSAVIWVKTPSASQRQIYMYYDNGNGRIASQSSISDVFDFFYNWDAIDHEIWTFSANGGTESVANSILSLYGGSGSGKYGNENTVATFNSTNKIVECYAKVDSSYRFFVGFSDCTVYHDISTSWFVAGAAKTHSAPTTGVYKIWKIAVSTDTAYGYWDGSLIGSQAYTPGASKTVVMSAWYAGTRYIDWIRVRAYAATEPTLSVGSTRINSQPPGHHGLLGITLTPGTEYVFDPVNVDHGMVAAAGAQEVECGAVNVAAGMVAAAGAQEVECGAVNINHPIYPTASWNRIIAPVTEESSTLISVTVSQGHEDPMAQAVFEHDGNSVGNYYSGDYMVQVHVKIPDYLGTINTVFVGIIPNSRAKYDTAKDKVTMTAVDYGLYLTKQVLEDKDLSLLPPADQISSGAGIAKTLSCDYITHPFQLGQRITGATSGATGVIIDIAGGHILWLYPASGNFVDDEVIQVGGIDVAYADGRSVDTPYSPPTTGTGGTISPADWVKSVLGGDNWMRVSGIEPYKIIPCAWTATSDPVAVPFMFGSKESKWAALQRLAKYLNYIPLVKTKPGSTTPAFYWVPLASMDDSSDGLDLPAPATITSPNDPYLAAPVTLDQNGENQVDRVKVCCQDLNGKWLTAIRTNSRVDYGEGPFREFYDEPKDICTQTDLNAYCTDMYNLHAARARIWSATLFDRSDLQLYQRLTISGFGIEIPDGTYRIIRISHEYGCAVNKVHISFMLSSEFSNQLRLGVTYTDSITEIQRVTKAEVDKLQFTEFGTCTATDTVTISYTSEANIAGRGRDGTGDGAILAGERIIIHHTRGGIVCLPVRSMAAIGTDPEAVDVPLMLQANVYIDDPAWYLLIWKPGANNDNVQIDIHTDAYSAAPKDGEMSKMFDISVNTARVAFIARETVHYISAWGVKNGRYSSTAKQISITSGTDLYENPDLIPVERPISVGATYYAESFTGSVELHADGGGHYYCFIRTFGGSAHIHAGQNFSAFSVTTYASDFNDGTMDIYIGGVKYLSFDTHECGTQEISIDFGMTYAAGTEIKVVANPEDLHIWKIKIW